ncbi:hypothetical protein A2631_00070 [Candidatus Daviesbacteria bacterium RIFCSPHIGHO2_01_FULL_44_29]|uniref:Uncharacterized protein n=1 Tax=Candidatus Daviesbacteria bacterium RIFCSPHIGHO2_02_FULL_43_12 TaxID=1797776 RepID=A0A1F5KIA4_9BACT|nr:MAG: hypothetical protein A2631_00070 [Candidatus Daviesbacteria bacterium RIFCSPHIGHO2_01_FULL_44_29]OGE40569.1 MAG: hypothetical protein A3D25_00425 [Candidatus Daviesbacteria bacterium RIFCSPHIGHO2_02_FULL_43_12]OGE40914.1 MAG: hypothetical protein A3E86_05490 [Candidatus Daviesbacteria bacterium RIFCSPHIGHO2_12_FULL_47_45]OGE70129.1 MAG: hypothetical protein A3B55_00195 [Candidatus Daviesbacteria bacterium RIFCSPLOWO2_01_FULL_43_15]
MVVETAGIHLTSKEQSPSISSRLFSYARALREPATTFLRAAGLALGLGIFTMAFASDYRLAMAAVATVGIGIAVLNRDIEKGLGINTSPKIQDHSGR